MRKMNKTAEEHRKEFGFGTGEKELYVRKKKKSLRLVLNLFTAGVESSLDKHPYLVVRNHKDIANPARREG